MQTHKESPHIRTDDQSADMRATTEHHKGAGEYHLTGPLLFCQGGDTNGDNTYLGMYLLVVQ